MPPRGGHRLKRGLPQDEPSSCQPSVRSRGVRHVDDASPLGKLLLEKWAWGILSAPSVQEIAMAAKLSGLISADIEHLASLGASGHSPQNIHRDMVRTYCKDLVPPEPHVLEVPMLVTEGTQVHTTGMPCELLLPHDWVSALDKAGLMEEIMGLSLLEQFWANHDMTDPKLVGNPTCSHMVPLLVHGDGAKFQQRDSIMVVSMKSVLSSESVRRGTLLLAALPKSCRTKANADELSGDSWHQIWRALAWSLSAMYEGVHPTRDVDGVLFGRNTTRGVLAGKPLTTAKVRFLVYTLTGDMEYFSLEMGLAHHASSTPCFRCPCTTGDIPWNDFRPNAQWRSLVYSPQQLREKPPTKHLVMGIPGVVAETFAFDALHVLDLGCAAHAIGNVFFDLVFEDFGLCKAVAMQHLQHLVLKEYSEQKIDCCHRFSRLKLEHFCDAGAPHQSFPCLRGVKARQTRYLVPVALALCKQHQGRGSYSLHRTQCLENLNLLYDTIDQGDMFLDEVAKKTFEKAMNSFLVHYTYLAKVAHGEGKLRWSTVPKFHYAAHMPSQAMYINPKMTWTYGGESMVGVISSLGHSCLAGTPPHKVPVSLMAKYRMAVHLAVTQKLD